MGQSLAIKYRPKTLEEICGQSITTKILEKAIEQKNLSMHIFSQVILDVAKQLAPVHLPMLLIKA